MNEGLPQAVGSNETLEKTPSVEHLFFSGNSSALVKISYPWDEDAMASVYVLSHRPASKAGMESGEAFLATLTNEHQIAAAKEFHEMTDKPLVFKGHAEAVEWFNAAKGSLDSRDATAVAAFLGVDNH